jgi:hypothetical protein
MLTDIRNNYKKTITDTADLRVYACTGLAPFKHIWHILDADINIIMDPHLRVD